MRIGCALLLGLLCCACASRDDEPDAGSACDHGTLCRDSDCDTICDGDEGAPSRDTDHDGTPDYLDDDADGDGVGDREEAGDDDPKTDPFDRDHDGVADYLDDSFPINRAPRAPDGGTGIPPSPADAAVLDGSGHYDQDAAALVPELCPADAIVAAACLTSETDLCDGIDNDCDGTVDGEALCDCERGAVRGCFTGPPGRRAVGACEDGTQVCVGDEFTHWGPCLGGRSPLAEACDGLDNDCNGCADEIAGCVPLLSCPGPNDPRTPAAKPFSPYALDASLFYQGKDALAYKWEVSGSPCDLLFATLDASATSTSGKLSYELVRATRPQAEVTFTLSGSYAVKLTITTPDGELSCAFTIAVRAPGLRVELCWDQTGPTAGMKAVDLDLHLGKQGATTQWSGPYDCYWETCRGATTPWSYENTKPVSACSGEGAQSFAAYSAIGHCPNPRLDTDNRLDQASASAYVTENINLDAPVSGDRFRVMVHYNTNLKTDAQALDAGLPPVTGPAHPIVNVFCGGALRGSFGGDPSVLADADEVAGFDTPGQMWRVADVLMKSTDCELAPLAAPAPATGYWLSDWDPAY